MDEETTVNARGLSAPGAAMMVQSALDKGACRRLRVIVDRPDAIDELQRLLEAGGASVSRDQVGSAVHVIANFPDEGSGD